MLWFGWASLVFGIVWSAAKTYILWRAAHDETNDSGVPTADFYLFCPIPIAFGLHILLVETGIVPFAPLGFTLYFVMVLVYLGVHRWIHSIGNATRQRQREETASRDGK